MLSIKVTIEGDKATLEKLKKLGKEIYNVRDAMTTIGKELSFYYANDVFNTQGGILNARWASLAPSTIRSKSKKYGIDSKNRILVASGAMRSDFESEADNNSVTISNSATYFKYHQSSGPRMSHLPRRQMMGINTQLKDVIRARINESVQKKIREFN